MSTSRTYYNRLEIISPQEISGCTQNTALNYNPDATVDDGSCIFLPPQIPGCTNPAASNYSSSANVDDGSCVFGSSNVVFDTASQKLVETNIGANITESDTGDLVGWTALAAALGLQTYYYTLASASMNNSHAATLNTFLSNVGANVALYYPIQNNAVAAAFPNLIDWIVLRFNPVLIQLDQESQNGAGLTNATYISRSRDIITRYPAIKTAWDTAPIWKSAPSGASYQRNLALQPLTDTDYGRQYEQISPDAVGAWSATDQDYNLELFNNYINVTLPTYNTDYFALLPNITKQVIPQWHNTDAGGRIPADALDNYMIGEMARYTLANTEKFAYLFYMKFANLVRGGVAQPLYESIKLVAPLFAMLYTMPVTLPFNNVQGQAFSDGGNTWKLLVTSQSAVTNTILSTDIVIPTKTISGNFTRNSRWAASWNGVMQADNIVSEANATVRPYSVNVISFTTT